jgi:competence protein ComEA
MSACIKRERSHIPSQSGRYETSSNGLSQANRINLNTASADELKTLPGIGPGFAARIIEHREKYGPFRRAEHLMIIRGISEKRFAKLREFVTVE